MSQKAHFDVIIIGSGIAGTTLATILGRQGHDVLLLEKGKHPRFAIGEATLPLGSLLFWTLGQTYDVPELIHLSSVDSIHEHVTKVCGQKRTLGFVHHVAGQEQNLQHMEKTIPPDAPLISESHLYREHVDVYVLEAAKRYGVTYRDQTGVADIAADADGVSVTTDGGETFTGRYLVDAAGYRSPVAQQFGLRDETPKLQVHSRSIFTHVTGLRPYDDVLPTGTLPELSRSMHHGTLHHVFDGGWVWVIPFGNHPGADSEISSVGVMLDTRKFPPRDDLSAEEEFWSVIDQYPGIAAHLKGIEPRRPWIRTGRVQYTSSACVGPRWSMLSHASAFVDPIFSQGLIMSIEVVRDLVPRLLSALADDDFSEKRFAPLQALQNRQVAANDRMAISAYHAMRSFTTWNAWLHVWIANELFGFMANMRYFFKFLASGDKELLTAMSSENVLADDMQALAEFAETALTRFSSGDVSAEDTAAAIYERLRGCDWLPHDLWGWGDPETRHLDLEPMERLGQLVMWGKTAAPERMQSGMFDFPPPPMGPPPGGEPAADMA